MNLSALLLPPASRSGGFPGPERGGLAPDVRNHLWWKAGGILALWFLVFGVKSNQLCADNPLARSLLIFLTLAFIPYFVLMFKVEKRRHHRVLIIVAAVLSFALETVLVTYFTVAARALWGHMYFGYLPFVLALIEAWPSRFTMLVGLGGLLSGYTVAGWFTQGRMNVFLDDMFWVHAIFMSLFLVTNHRFTLVFKEREEWRKTAQKLDRLSSLDHLTGLLNRRSFDVRLAEEVERARAWGKPLALLMADLDFFKLYNDCHGHDRGDEVLRAVARAIRASVRQQDSVFRYGGEEFAVLLPETGREEAFQVAERVRKAVEELGIPLPSEAGHSFSSSSRLTVSLGVAVFPADAATARDLVREADRALYQAKQRGRNAVCGIGSGRESEKGLDQGYGG